MTGTVPERSENLLLVYGQTSSKYVRPDTMSHSARLFHRVAEYVFQLIDTASTQPHATIQPPVANQALAAISTAEGHI